MLSCLMFEIDRRVQYLIQRSLKYSLSAKWPSWPIGKIATPFESEAKFTLCTCGRRLGWVDESFRR